MLHIEGIMVSLTYQNINRPSHARTCSMLIYCYGNLTSSCIVDCQDGQVSW